VDLARGSALEWQMAKDKSQIDGPAGNGSTVGTGFRRSADARSAFLPESLVQEVVDGSEEEGVLVDEGRVAALRYNGEFRSGN
jgi:hypothetical protein